MPFFDRRCCQKQLSNYASRSKDRGKKPTPRLCSDLSREDQDGRDQKNGKSKKVIDRQADQQNDEAEKNELAQRLKTAGFDVLGSVHWALLSACYKPRNCSEAPPTVGVLQSVRIYR